MKAYVLKNKEGKYLSSSFDYDGEPIFTDCIVDAMPYDDYDIVACPNDFEVVEITIAECNLEQQIRADERRKVCEEIRNFMTQDSCLTKEELIECLESFTAKSIFQLLDQIEGESK